MELNLYSNVQVFLKEISSERVSQKGKLRWNLQKKLESDPSCSILLIRVLVRELENCYEEAEKKNPKVGVDKVYKTESFRHIIPVLHTLYYVVIQTNMMIPVSLYETVYDCLIKLLILPSPYSNVALSTLRSIKMEMNTPGSLYQRRVISEQNLKNEHCMLQEKVFVLADPLVFSHGMDTTFREYLEVPSFHRMTSTMEKNVVQHVLQTGLGMTCQKVVQALECLGENMVEKYFQDLVVVVEESIKCGAAGRANYLLKLQDIYSDIISASKKEFPKEHNVSVYNTAMPFPEVNFILWKYEDELWDLMSNFALYCENSSIDEDKDNGVSVKSVDCGTVRDLVESDGGGREKTRNQGSVLTRRNAFKNMKAADKLSLVKEKMEAFPGSSPVLKGNGRHHTARVVVMGDDRVLGKLAKAYHSIRERESKQLFLTKKLNLQLYYIPVTKAEPSISPANIPGKENHKLSFASLLGKLDPWYDSNINSLQTSISKLMEMNSDASKPATPNLFLLDTLCYYLRCGSQPVNLPLYSIKMTRSNCDAGSVVEDIFLCHLEADIPEFRHLKQKSTGEPSFSRGKKTSSGDFGTVISISYTKMSLSKRKVVKGEAPMAYGVVITSEPAAATSGDNYLSLRFDCINPGCNTSIKAQKICIRTLESRTLSVCLDKDSRRTYTDVQRMEVCPCLDPGYSLHTRFNVSTEQEQLLSKYLDKVLSLPINTFTGVTS